MIRVILCDDHALIRRGIKRLTLIDLSFGDAGFHLARYSDALVA